MSKRTAIKPSKELLCAMLRDPKTTSIHYNIFVGKKTSLDKLAETLEADFPPQSLAKYPDAMAQGLKEHYNNKSVTETAAKVGYIRARINTHGNKVIASTVLYYPKENVDCKKIHGINPALWEARILERLRDAEGVTHATTADGYYHYVDRPNPGVTSDNRRNQLIARGIDPMKIYRIKEWIEKLKKKPDYSKIKK